MNPGGMNPGMGQPGNPMNNGMGNPNNNTGGGGDPGPRSKPDGSDADALRKATDLAVGKKFREMLESGEISPEMLKKLNWTREDWEKFRQRYRDLQARGIVPNPEDIRRGAGGKTNLTGGIPGKTITGGKNELPTESDGAPEPPRELNDTFSPR